ncbi:MAG: DUF971 domain-containing protein [Myxococcales bacterium]|nr:DUF971 domain-containing protein [Myxococcales bacterium]
MPLPVDVALSRSQHLLTIEWDDGLVTALPIAYLRGWCPCAACQGHGTVVQFHEPTDPALDIEQMSQTGAYALSLRFSDGHDSGIYTWSWLRRIALETPPLGEKRGRFVAGRFED